MRILFMGTPDFAVPSLRALIENSYNVVGVVTQPDRPKGRKQVLTPTPVKILAEEYGLPVYQPERVSSPDFVALLRTLDLDLIVTAAFGQLLSPEVLAIPRLACLNVHASLLPKYRGGAPIHWSVINGEEVTGVTIMEMAEKLDAGPIYSQVEIPITEDDTTGLVYDKVTQAGASLLIETLPGIINQEIKAIDQDHSQATFAYNVNREDEKIDWTKSNKEIYNHIRGLAPWPGAYTNYQGQVMKLWQARIYEVTDVSSIESGKVYEPGEVVYLDQEGPVIQTGQGMILLLEVQPAGKKKITGRDLVNSGKIELKTCLI